MLVRAANSSPADVSHQGDGEVAQPGPGSIAGTLQPHSGAAKDGEHPPAAGQGEKHAAAPAPPHDVARHHSAYQPQHSRPGTLLPSRPPTISEDHEDGSLRAGGMRGGGGVIRGGSPGKLANVASKGSIAGVEDDDLSESKLLKSLRLAPLSMSSRDHRDGWLHMEPSVKEAAASAAASSPKRRIETVRSSENLEMLSPTVRSVTASSPRHYTPSMRSGTNTPSGMTSTRGGMSEFVIDQMVQEAWDNLRKSRVLFRGSPVGTIAALDTSEAALNYDQVFVRDFVPSALAFLMNGEHDIVRNFLLKTLRLQSWEKRVDVFTLGEGVMPASFKVLHDPKRNMDTMVADFGESAIGRVAPVDSGFWWIILLRAYVKATGDTALAESPDCQRGMRLILNLCLADGFDTFPTLLCADGCCMIDRRMGIYGYPIEIQSLFYMALRIARGLLRPDVPGNKELLERIDKRLLALSYHMRTYFWLDHEQLNSIYRYKTEEYSHTAVNKFNVIPDSIPDWLFDFMPTRGGYFVGNVSPARMDFRWFALGNCIAILACMATREQSLAIMDLIEERWDELLGEMPLKVVYPALENHEWRITTGCDPKNTRWSYHNGGSWPVLLWMLTAAAIKVGRPHVARRAIEIAEMRLSRDNWPEYYDGKLGRYVGKQSRKLQTWSIAGYLVSKMLLEDPSHVGMVALEEERKLEHPTFARSQSWRY